MKKWIIIGAVLITTTLSGAYIAQALNQPDQISNLVPETRSPQTQIVQLLAASATPDVVFVKVGDKVQFNNIDGGQHEIASGQGNAHGMDHEHIAGGIESGLIAADEGFKVSFDKEGIFYFHDNLNPDITISVIVSE